MSKGMKKMAFLQKNNPMDYNLQIRESINLLSAKGNKPSIFGSSSYKAMIYTGDIDLKQKLSYKEQEKQIPQIIKKIISDPNYGTIYQLGDIKIGTTPWGEELQKYIGTFEDGKLLGYKPEEIKKIIKQIPGSVFKNLEIPKIYENKHGEINAERWYKLYYFIHNISTIRWTPKEVIEQKNKEGITFKEAILTSDLSKVDLYSFLNGKYTEITNFYYNDMKDITEEKILDGLRVSLLKYKFVDINYMKIIKRVYAIARIKKDYKMLDILKNFINGNVSLMSSVRTDIEVILSMVDYGFIINNNKDNIMSHIGQTINKVSNIFVVDLSSEINKKLNSIQNLLCKNKNYDITIIKTLKECSDILKNYMNKLAEEYIKINLKISLFY